VRIGSLPVFGAAISRRRPNRFGRSSASHRLARPSRHTAPVAAAVWCGCRRAAGRLSVTAFSLGLPAALWLPRMAAVDCLASAVAALLGCLWRVGCCFGHQFARLPRGGSPLLVSRSSAQGWQLCSGRPRGPGPTSRGASVWAADKPTVQSSLKSIRSTTRRRSRGRCAGGWGTQLQQHSESQPTRLRNRCCNPYKSCATT
jgi:hypothetical protein